SSPERRQQIGGSLMKKSALAAGLVAAAFVSAYAPAAFAAAAPAIDNVCLVTFSNASLGASRDVRGIAEASVLPRETAQIIVKNASDVSFIYSYADLNTTVRACQCLKQPAPATSMAERYRTMMACPQPSKVN